MTDTAEFLRKLVEEEGVVEATHLLADALEKRADDELDEEDSYLRCYAAKLREVAGERDA